MVEAIDGDKAVDFSVEFCVCVCGSVGFGVDLDRCDVVFQVNVCVLVQAIATAAKHRVGGFSKTLVIYILDWACHQLLLPSIIVL